MTSGSAQQPEDEREAQDAWEDPDGGDLPWEPPRTAETPESWKPADWSGTPQERMWRDKMNTDADADDGA